MRYYHFITDHIKANVAHLLKCAFDQRKDKIKSENSFYRDLCVLYTGQPMHSPSVYISEANEVFIQTRKPILYALIIIMPHFSPHPTARTLRTTFFMLENPNLI